jgi:hypothetical protein
MVELFVMDEMKAC